MYLLSLNLIHQKIKNPRKKNNPSRLKAKKFAVLIPTIPQAGIPRLNPALIPMDKKVYLETLGCSKNRVDSEIMLGSLNNQGYQFTDDAEEAEVIIVNTLSLIHI